MALDTGRQVQIFAGIEKPSGTLQSTAGNLFLLPHSGSTFQQQNDKKKLEDALGNIDNYSDQYNVRTFSSGDIEGFITADSIGILFVLMFGQLPDTAGSTQYTHTFTKANTSTGSTASIYRFSGDNYKEAMAGVRLASLDLNFMADDRARYRGSFIGQAPTTSSQDVPTYDPATTSYFQPDDVNVKLVAAEGDLSGATPLEARSCVVKFSSALTGYATLGQTGYGAIVSGGYDVMIELTMLFENDTQRDLWINDTERYLQIEATSETIGAVSPKITLNFPSVKVESWDDSKTLGTQIEETFTLTSYAHNDDTRFNAELINGISKTKYGS